MKFMFGERGATLVELMVVAAMMGGMALVGAQLTSNMNKGVTTVETKSDLVQTFSEIRGYLSSVPACTNTLGTTTNYSSCRETAKPTAAPCLINAGEIRDQNNLIKFAINNNPNTAQAKVGNALHLHSAWINEYSVPSGGSGNMKLNILFKNLKFDRKAAYGPAEVVKSIPLNVSVNVANMITSCQNASSGTNDIWAYFPDFNGIFYNAGGVVIGTTTNGTIAPQPSLAVGTNNRMLAKDSFVLGQDNFVKGGTPVSFLDWGGAGTFVHGWDNDVSGGITFVSGNGNNISSQFSTVFGSNNVIGTNPGLGMHMIMGVGNNVHYGVASANPAANIVIGHGNGRAVLGNEFNKDTVFTHAVKGQQNIVIGSQNTTSSSTIQKSVTIGHRMKADASGTLNLGDNSPTPSLDSGDDLTVNSVANSLLARFKGGYRFWMNPNNNVDGTMVGVDIKINDPSPTVGDEVAYMGINQGEPNPGAEANTTYVLRSAGGAVKFAVDYGGINGVTIKKNLSPITTQQGFLGINANNPWEGGPLVFKSFGNLHISAPQDNCVFGVPPLTLIGTLIVNSNDPTKAADCNDGISIRNNPFPHKVLGPLGAALSYTRGRTWMGINKRTPSDPDLILEVNGEAKIDKIRQESWQALPIPAGAGCGAPPSVPMFRKDSSGFVHFKGGIRSTSAFNGEVGIAIPSGYRGWGQFRTSHAKIGGGPQSSTCTVHIANNGYIAVRVNPLTSLADQPLSTTPQYDCCMLYGVIYEAEN